MADRGRAEPSGPDSRSVLVVEDDGLLRDLIARALEGRRPVE